MVNVFSECCSWLSCGESGTVVIKHSLTPRFPCSTKIQFNFRDESLPPEILKLSEFSIKLVDEQGVKLVLNKKNPYGIFIH
jgi:hypothetical protein